MIKEEQGANSMQTRNKEIDFILFASGGFGPSSFQWPQSMLLPLPQAPDLDEVRESVRQGVTKVAGRLGSLANNVMSSLQVLE